LLQTGSGRPEQSLVCPTAAIDMANRTCRRNPSTKHATTLETALEHQVRSAAATVEYTVEIDWASLELSE